MVSVTNMRYAHIFNHTFRPCSAFAQNRGTDLNWFHCLYFLALINAFHSICMLVLRPPFLCGSNNGWGDIGFDTHTENNGESGLPGVCCCREDAPTHISDHSMFESPSKWVCGSALVDVWVSLKLNPIWGNRADILTAHHFNPSNIWPSCQN